MRASNFRFILCKWSKVTKIHIFFYVFLDNLCYSRNLCIITLSSTVPLGSSLCFFNFHLMFTYLQWSFIMITYLRGSMFISICYFIRLDAPYQCYWTFQWKGFVCVDCIVFLLQMLLISNPNFLLPTCSYKICWLNFLSY